MVIQPVSRQEWMMGTGVVFGTVQGGVKQSGLYSDTE